MRLPDNNIPPRTASAFLSSKGISLFADVAITSILWMITSLFIITIGASTTAAYATVFQRIPYEKKSVFKDYFTAFKEYFIKATIIHFIVSPLLIINILSVTLGIYTGEFNMIFFAFQILLIIECTFISVHIYPLLAKFNLDLKLLAKTTLVLAHKHMLTSILLIITFIAVVYVSFFMLPMLILVSFGIYCLISSYLLLKLYKKYQPAKSDNDSNSEIEKEPYTGSNSDSD